MGRHYPGGYSAHVEGFLIVGGRRTRLAKTNGYEITLAKACEARGWLPAGTEAELLSIIDGHEWTRRVTLPDGIAAGQTVVGYKGSYG